MEETGGGGSLCFDLNEEAAGVRAGLGALKDRSIALLAGVSGGQGAGKGHFYVTGNGRNVNTDASVHPPPVESEVMLVERSLADRLTDRCVVSGDVGDHRGLNGFTESLCQAEPAMVALEEGGAAGSRGLAGAAAASCPPVLGTRVSVETGRESTGEIPDVTVGGEESTGCVAVTANVRTSLPIERLPCLGKQQRNCACTAGLQGPTVDMSNGVVDSEDPGLDTAYNPTGGVSRPGVCDVDCGEVKLANGGLHMVKSSRATCDSSDSDPDIHEAPRAGPETGHGSGFSLHSGGEVTRCPGEDAPAAAELSPSPGVSPTPDSSAKLPSPCPSPPSKLNSGRPLSEPEPEPEPESEEEEEEVGFGDLSLPVRPQSLRTNPGLPVSLSCDATPLSPDQDGGFYFGDDGYMEECRGALEAAGRRQSAPDKLPDLTDHTDCLDGKLMPKRFGIADFFTRSLFSRKSKEPKAPTHNATGWRLFSKTGARGGDPAKDPTSTVSNPQWLRPVRSSMLSLWFFGERCRLTHLWHIPIVPLSKMSKPSCPCGL